jgi:hypothetical protein
MLRIFSAALFALSATADFNKITLLSALTKLSANEEIWAPVLDVSAILPGTRTPGLKSFSTVLMHGLGDAGSNPGMALTTKEIFFLEFSEHVCSHHCRNGLAREDCFGTLEYHEHRSGCRRRADVFHYAHSKAGKVD